METNENQRIYVYLPFIAGRRYDNYVNQIKLALDYTPKAFTNFNAIVEKVTSDKKSKKHLVQNQKTSKRYPTWIY